FGSTSISAQVNYVNPNFFSAPVSAVTLSSIISIAPTPFHAVAASPQFAFAPHNSAPLLSVGASSRSIGTVNGQNGTDVQFQNQSTATFDTPFTFDPTGTQNFASASAIPNVTGFAYKAGNELWNQRATISDTVLDSFNNPIAGQFVTL